MKQFIDKVRQTLGMKSDIEAGGELGYEVPSGRGSIGTAEDYQLGPDDGVRIHPMPLTKDESATIAYGGLLAKAGAENIFLHCGEGPGDWKNVQDIPMEPAQSGEWIAGIDASSDGTIEFCFHDGAGNWDNNSGVNWSVTVHDGRFPH